jgi:glycosyltransferase involved in cell wall biosynthesis
MEVADPALDFLVFAGDFSDSSIQTQLLSCAQAPKWNGKVTFAGRLSDTDAADVLAAADAIVLPFREGAGPWSSSLHAAVTQGSFVLTTTAGAPRYDEGQNVYYAAATNVVEMKSALTKYAGRKLTSRSDDGAWGQIAASHKALYLKLLSGRPIRFESDS